MPSTPSKGSLRAAHQARTKRHAQRTPLPERGQGTQHGETLRKAAEATTGKTVCPHCGARGSVAGLPGHIESAHPEQAAETAAATTGRRAGRAKTFGDQTDTLAAQVKEMRDAGKMWRDIADELGLGEAKTGTSRARRLYRQANGGSSAPKKERAPRGRRTTRRVIVVDGEEQVEETTGGVPLMGRVAVYSLAARDERKLAKGKRRMAPVNVGHIGDEQVRSLTRIFEADGYTVTTTDVTREA